MENTPLELYEKAYKLHYEEKKISEAIVYYKKLINEFPDSNECGYAVIQLQKIKANEVAKDINDLLEDSKKNSKLLPFLIFSIVLFLLYFTTLFLVVRSFSEKINLEQKRNSLMFNALGKLIIKNDSGALEILSELKKISPQDITPYELSAYVYRLQKKEEESINEYSTFFALNPNIKPSENELKYLKKIEQRGSKSNSKIQTTADTTLRINKKKEVEKEDSSQITKKNVPSLKPSKPQPSKPIPPAPEKGKKKKGLLLIDPDSISYF